MHDNSRNRKQKVKNLKVEAFKVQVTELCWSFNKTFPLSHLKVQSIQSLKPINYFKSMVKAGVCLKQWSFKWDAQVICGRGLGFHLLLLREGLSPPSRVDGEGAQFACSCCGTGPVDRKTATDTGRPRACACVTKAEERPAPPPSRTGEKRFHYRGNGGECGVVRGGGSLLLLLLSPQNFYFPKRCWFITQISS